MRRLLEWIESIRPLLAVLKGVLIELASLILVGLVAAQLIQHELSTLIT